MVLRLKTLAELATKSYNLIVKISITSDVHIKKMGDKGSKYFETFLNSEQVNQCDCIMLLGDIFDLMVGEHFDYIKLYEPHFKRLKELVDQGKVLYFFQGNHDFHIESTFKEYFHSDNFQFIRDLSIQLNLNGKKVRFSHGDDIEVDNVSYQKYKKFIRSGFIKLLANKVVPFRFVKAIGDRASQKSRKHNQKYDEKKEEIKEKFRDYAKRASRIDDSEVVVCGHSHVKDHFVDSDLEYINNGYASSSNSFIYFDSEKFQFIEL